MSYAIGTIVYGVPLTEKVHEAFNELMEEEDLDIDVGDYFDTLYTASGPHVPGYCGVELGEFDECCDAIPFHDLQAMAAKATPDKIAQAIEKFQALPEKIQKACDTIGVYVVWSSS